MKNVIRKAGGWAIWALILLLGLNLAKDISHAREIKSQIDEQKAKVAKIESENAKLEAELLRTQSADFIEKQVRDKLGLGREGEAVVVLPEPEILKKLAPELNREVQTLPDPNWLRWVRLFIVVK